MQTLQENTTLQGGKYRIISVLGQGGFGITYLAEQTMLERKVAVKEFYMKELCSRDGSTSHVTIGTEGSRETVTRFREKFLKEARNIAKFNHPNIVKIIDVFEENGTAYYVMEYAEGGSLADKVNRQGYLSEPVATRYILQVAEALAYVHARKMNHLDVKPANIMLTGTDTAVLIDFGLSKQYNVGGQQTSTTPVGISEGYAPMEQYKQGGVGEFSPETDIYALGATFFKLLTGVTPPSASDVNEDGAPVNELKAKGVSEKAIEVICEAMKPRKKERMKDARGFINALDNNKGNASEKIEEESTIMNAEKGKGENIMTAIEEESLKKEKDKEVRIHKVKKAVEKAEKEWKKTLRGCIWAVILAILLIVVCIISIVNLQEKQVEYSIEGIAKTLSERKCRIDEIYESYWWRACLRYSEISDNLILVLCNKKHGYMNYRGEIVISCVYDDAQPFSESLACIKKNGKWGYIDKQGKEIISLKYDDAQPFSESLACIKKDGKWGYIDKQGREIISLKYDQAASFSDGLARVDINGKTGFIDKHGDVVIPLISRTGGFWGVGSFYEGLAHFDYREGKKEYLGFMDKNGNEVIPPKYKGTNIVVGEFSESLNFVCKGDKYGYIDKNGNEIIPFKYDFASSFSEGLAAVCEEEKWGYIDKKGKVVIPFKYDHASDFSEGLASIKKGGKCGYIDKNGNEVIPCKYDGVSKFSGGLALVKNEGSLLGVIDKEGKCTYDYYKREKQKINPDFH